MSDIVDGLSKNQKVLVGGRLQTGVSKLDDGTEKKVFEIEASSIELMSGSASISSSEDDGDILSFGDMGTPADESADVLMSDEEVPF